MKVFKFLIGFLCISFCYTCNLTGSGEEKGESTSGEYYELGSFRYKMNVENATEKLDSLPLVIVMHSMGSTPDTYKERVKDFKIPVRIIYVEGTYNYGDGYSFFPLKPINYYEMPHEEKHNSLVQETEKIADFIRAANSKYKPIKNPVVIGASQGGDLSYMIGIKNPELISAAFPLLATLDEVTKQTLNKKKQFKPIRVFHGQDDSVVSITSVRKHVKDLQENNLDIELFEYEDCDHQITKLMKEQYIEEISKLLRLS